MGFCFTGQKGLAMGKEGVNLGSEVKSSLGSVNQGHKSWRRWRFVSCVRE